MSLNRLVTVADIVAITTQLSRRSTGADLETLRKTLDSKLLDKRRLKAYVDWGFIERTDGNIETTSLGRDFARASETERCDSVLRILRHDTTYFSTLEYIFNMVVDERSLSDIGAYWRQHFTDQVSGSENTLKEQVMCFARLVDFAKVGVFKAGRRGKESRIEFNRDSLATLVAEELQPTDVEPPADSTEAESALEHDSQESTKASEEPKNQVHQQSDPLPELHIDIQIHISPDADASQIDQIFASMAKHLYGRVSDKS